MILEISTHRRGSTRYDKISSKMKKMSSDPEFITLIRVKVPESRIFSVSTIASVDKNLTPLFRGQLCDQFGLLVNATVFWGEDGRLSGSGAVHIFAHMLLAVINGKADVMMSGQDLKDKKPIVIQDRIYRPDRGDKEVLNVAFSGRYSRKAFSEAVYKVFQAVEVILDMGEVEDKTDYGDSLIEP